MIWLVHLVHLSILTLLAVGFLPLWPRMIGSIEVGWQSLLETASFWVWCRLAPWAAYWLIIACVLRVSFGANNEVLRGYVRVTQVLLRWTVTMPFELAKLMIRGLLKRKRKPEPAKGVSQ